VASLPAVQDVRELFAMLLRRVVSVSGGPAASGPGAVAGVYSDDQGGAGAVAVFDLALAGRAGAALSMIPVGMVAESIRRGQLADNLLDNLAEVLNVANALFNDGSGPHLKLSSVVPIVTGECAPVPSRRLDTCVKIAGYGVGALSLIVLERSTDVATLGMIR
jgi:hypothetical protein